MRIAGGGGSGSSGGYTLKSALEDVIKSQSARKEPVVEEKVCNVDVDGDEDLFRDDYGSIGGGLIMDDLSGAAVPAAQCSGSVALSDENKHQQDDEPEVKQRPKKKRKKKAKKFV